MLQTGSVSSDPRLGTSLSHYRLDEQIGRGGMGVVYLAFDQLSLIHI